MTRDEVTESGDDDGADKHGFVPRDPHDIAQERDPKTPSAAQAIRVILLLRTPRALLGFVLNFGVRVFSREAPRIAEDL